MTNFKPGAARSLWGVLMSGAALAASPAVAQSVPASSTQDADKGLTDIIVTAQRRSERLQDVPVAITAVNASALAEARVESLATISNVSPSIQFFASNNAASSANVVIRGLGTTGNSRTFEGAVGIFIDGVYRTRAASALQNFLDIDSVQVLRGPQGALFGKNTSAGAVLIGSTNPDINRVKGNLELSYGNYGARDAKGGINIPFSDVVALRVAALYSDDDGFIKNPNNGEHYNGLKSQAYKVQLLIEPSDDFSMRVIGDYSKSTGNCCYGTVNYVNGPTQPLVDALTLARGVKLPSYRLQDREQVLNSPSYQSTEDYGVTLLLNFGIGGDSLRTITALREFNITQIGSDSDFSGADIFNMSETFKSQFLSQEVTFNGKVESLNADYVLGAFYSDEQLDMVRGISWGTQGQAFVDALLAARGAPPGTAYAAPGYTAGEIMGGKATSYAAFAHISADVSDSFSVFAGLRYSVEKKRGSFRYSFYRPEPNNLFRLLGTQPGPAYDVPTTNKALSGTAGIQYRPGEDAMIYLTYNRGFKAGGVNIDANGGGTRINNPAEVPGGVPLDPRFKPETVNAIELGAKLDYWGKRARTNIAFFYNDISNLQVAQFVGLQFTVLNARSAKTYGAEFESLFEVMPGVTLGVDGIWLPHARYGTDPSLDVALSGQRFRFASKFAGNTSLSIDQPVAGGINLTGRVQYRYLSSQYINTASSTRRGSVGVVNGNIGIKSDKGWQIEGWIENALNKTYPTLSFSPPLQIGDENAYLGAPRTYGITLRGSF